MRPHIENAKPSTPREGFIPNPKLKLLDQVSEVMRFKHYSIRTETTYREWIKRFIIFHGKRHPREMGALEVERFLSDLAVRRIQPEVSGGGPGVGLAVRLSRGRSIPGPA